ncbi:hypothetical protein DAMNIGENAA_17320 [Desulforhabdus amnigena]|uniref:Uncharacterized protein n=2 Tax=Desulforhabdus amnigena TaxID=40218 RepID=A0A9W6D3M8_9BACT|nr:hypothetical protein DAMNIGENAA_17320 [Desulforhabdus amnigena]
MEQKLQGRKLMTECNKCGTGIEPGESYEFQGKLLCEDCYMDVMNPPKTCDPWAVHLAKSSIIQDGFQLTALQEEILSLLKEHGPMQMEEITAKLEINEAEFRNAFATLRHMELARGFKKGDNVYYTLFSQE